MVRKKDADENPTKYMGHGICDNFSKSISLPEPTDNHMTISKHSMTLLNSWQHIAAKPSDLRGIGIQITKLCDASSSASSRTLFDFGKTVTATERQQQQQQQQQQQMSALSRITSDPSGGDNGSTKLQHHHQKTFYKNPSIQSFMQQGENGAHQNNMELSPKKLPPLPSISLDIEENPSTSASTSGFASRNDLQVNTFN